MFPSYSQSEAYLEFFTAGKVGFSGASGFLYGRGHSLHLELLGDQIPEQALREPCCSGHQGGRWEVVTAAQPSRGRHGENGAESEVLGSESLEVFCFE